MATPFMNLDLPTASVTLGPEWATELNAALEVVDAHDHTTGKGPKITPAAININDELDFNSRKAVNLFSSQFIDQPSTLTGAANARSIYVVGGDLYYTNGAGVAIQITSGGTLVSTPGAITAFSTTSPAGDLVITPSDTFTYILVDTSIPRTITLPLASAVVSGRLFYIKDKSGNAKTANISLVPTGADTIDGVAGTVTLDSNYGTTLVVGDGISAWNIS
jgi:hypothetical protein